MGLKSWFAKMLGNYGDDALRLANKSDDIAASVHGMDDFLPFPDTPSTAYVGDKLFTFSDGYDSQSRLKNALLSKHRNPIGDVRDAYYIPPPSQVPSWDGIYDNFVYSNRTRFPEKTNFLGDVTALAQAPSNKSFTLELPDSLDTSQLVLQTPESSQHEVLGLRPHNNTALGKWFRKKMPNYGIEVDIPDFPF